MSHRYFTQEESDRADQFLSPETVERMNVVMRMARGRQYWNRSEVRRFLDEMYEYKEEFHHYPHFLRDLYYVIDCYNEVDPYQHRTIRRRPGSPGLYPIEEESDKKEHEMQIFRWGNIPQEMIDFIDDPNASDVVPDSDEDDDMVDDESDAEDDEWDDGEEADNKDMDDEDKENEPHTPSPHPQPNGGYSTTPSIRS